MAACALVLGEGQGWADVADYLTVENGWTQVTDASGITTDGNCVYVIASEFENLVVGIPNEGSESQLTYQTLNGQPDRKKVWYIEEDTYGTGGYAFKSLAKATNNYLTATNAWDMNVKSASKNLPGTCYTLNFDGSGNLTIQTNSEVNSDNPDRYWGDWTVGTHSDGSTLAGNKQSENKVTFHLYKKSLGSANNISFLIGNNGFEGSYSSIKTINSGTPKRYVFQPEGWTVDFKEKSGKTCSWTMTAVKSSDEVVASNFTGTYEIPSGNNKYMVRFRDNEDYLDLSQNLTIEQAGLYILSADLISENGTVKAELYAGEKTVSNLNNATWENKQLLLRVSANETLKIGVKFTNISTSGAKAGVDNIELKKLIDTNVDITGVVNNPNFDSNINGQTAPSGGAGLANNKTDQTTNFYETWNATPKQGRMYQQISNLPSGTYKLRAFAFADQLGTMTPINTDVCIYAQGQEVGTTSSSHIHRNYVNDVNFAYYNTYAYVDATGKLEIGMRQDVATFRWLGMDNVTLEYVSAENLEDELLLAELQSKWATVKDTYASYLSNEDYNCVTGSERSALEDAPKAAVDDIGDYTTNCAALKTAYNNFINAKGSYDAFDAEKAAAIAMGVTSEAANAAARPASASSDDLETALRGLYVLEDAAVTAGYTIDATNIFGSWVEQNTGSASGQHWSGDGRSYIDKNSNSGFTMSVTNTVTLPAGHYVFKAAARAASGGVNGAFNMSVKVGDNDAVYKDYIAHGDTGKGIDTSGSANYGDGTYANDGAGRGWEWRFISFDLDEETSVEMKVYAQILANKWVSFSDISLFTTDDNIGICEMMWTNAKDAAEEANENPLYTNITGKEKTDIVNAIAATETEPTTSVGYKSQETALVDATTAFIAAKEAYDNYEVEKPIATALGVDVPAINSATTTATVLKSNLQTINVSEYNAATTNYGYNATSLLGSWDNAPNENKGESWNGTADDTYYDLYNSASRIMSQTVTLPKAKYVFMAKGRASTNGLLTMSDGTNTIAFPHKSSIGKGIEIDGTANFGDGEYANSNAGRGWEYRYLAFESDGSASKTLTYNWTTASNNWAGLDDITLLAIPESVSIAEDDDSAPTYAIANATLTRTLSASYWNTFSVPFDMEIPASWTVKEFDSAVDNVINFKDATTIKAGKPYLVKPADNVVNPTFNGVIVENTEGETVGEGDYKFAAQIYNKALATNGTIAYLSTNGMVKKLTSGGLKGLRAYFIIPAGASARIAFLGDHDETTGISEMKSQPVDNGNIYDLNGRRVQTMKKGIYVVNGKKIVK